MRRPLTVFATLFLLWILIGQVNHLLSAWRVSLFLGGLYIVFAALKLRRSEGLGTVFAAGLLVDAQAPVPFGLHALLFATAYTVVFRFRTRIPRDDSLLSIVVALLANLGIFLGLSFFALRNLPTGTNAWPRLLTDLALSQVVLAFVAPWYLALQTRALEIVGADLRLDQPGMR